MSEKPSSDKYTAPLTETPQTIQVIPRTLLDEQGATTLTDALRNVPGITMQAGEGGGASNTSGDMFNMRGFSANNSLFVDNVRDDGMLARDVFNLEQIEVFSGPTGSDVGRTNAAGYINLATKVPQRAEARSGSLTYGSASQVRVTADLNQPLPMGQRGTFFGNAAIRVNALWQDGGVAGRNEARRESKSIAPSIAFGLSTPTRATLSAPDHAAGQSRRLRTACSRVARRPPDPDFGHGGDAGRSVELLRKSRRRLRPRRSGQRPAPAGARLRRHRQPPQPDALQHDNARGP